MPRQAKQGNPVSTLVPKQTPFTQTQTQNQKSTHATAPSLLQTVKEGFAFGVGSAVARTAVDSLFSGNSKSTVSPPPKQTAEKPCRDLLDSYESCLRLSSQDTTCSNEMISFLQCLHNESQSKPETPQ